MARFLMLVTLGPVQGFIAVARRSRDLWFGSQFLSEVSKSVAKEIFSSAGSQLIFPAPASASDLKPFNSFTVANKILSVIEEEPALLGKRLVEVARQRTLELAEESLKAVTSPALRKNAVAQLEDLPELYWVAVPYSGDEARYTQERALAEHLMAARKGTRSFKPVTWGSSSPKSSLDGQRESVLAANDLKSLSDTALRRKYGTRRGEHLCAISLMKRKGVSGRGLAVYSTSHVAAMPLIRRITATDEHAVQEFIEALTGLDIDGDILSGGRPTPKSAFNYDGHLLFAERLAEFVEKESLPAAQRALDRFLATSSLKGARPLPYYALMQADGDWMGVTINAQKSAGAHRAFSVALASFAATVSSTIDSFDGSLIYAGGDDILALLPVHTVLACAQRLAQHFSEQLAAFGPSGKKPTLSVGIAIAHHLEPLEDSLSGARQAEKQAKLVSGKNALAVNLMKRSGSDTLVAGKWGTLDKRLLWFAALHKSNEIPDGVAFELRDLAQRLPMQGDHELLAATRAVREYEIERILKRKGIQDKTILQNLVSLLVSEVDQLENIANELIIARLFAQYATLAQAELAAAYPGEAAV